MSEVSTDMSVGQTLHELKILELEVAVLYPMDPSASMRTSYIS